MSLSYLYLQCLYLICIFNVYILSVCLMIFKQKKNKQTWWSYKPCPPFKRWNVFIHKNTILTFSSQHILIYSSLEKGCANAWWHYPPPFCFWVYLLQRYAVVWSEREHPLWTLPLTRTHLYVSANHLIYNILLFFETPKYFSGGQGGSIDSAPFTMPLSTYKLKPKKNKENPHSANATFYHMYIYTYVYKWRVYDNRWFWQFLVSRTSYRPSLFYVLCILLKTSQIWSSVLCVFICT